MAEKERVIAVALREIVDHDEHEEATSSESAEIYKRRAAIRNSFRAWHERIPLAARFFGTMHVPSVTADDVCRDEEEYRAWLADIFFRTREYPSLSDALADVDEERNFSDLSEEEISNEEHVRYLLTKIGKCMEGRQYDEANALHAAAPLSLRRNRQALYFLDFCLEKKGSEHLRLLAAQSDSEFIVSWLKLSNMMPNGLAIVQSVTKEHMRTEEMQRALRIQLAKILRSTHPSIYRMFARTLEFYGFLDGDKLRTSPEIRGSIAYLLRQYARVDLHAYLKIRECLTDAGLITEEEADRSGELQDAIIDQLTLCMRKSPKIYRVLRDRWVNHGLIEQSFADEHPGVRDALDDFLVECIERHPRMYRQFLRLAAFYGVEPFDADLLERTLWSKEESLKESAYGEMSQERFGEILEECSEYCKDWVDVQSSQALDVINKLDFVLTDFGKIYPASKPLLRRGRRAVREG